MGRGARIHVMATSFSDRNRELVRRIQQGDRAAAEALLAENVGLVLKFAKRALPGAGSLELEDLLQEGRLGLLEAARKYDPGQGAAFSTYAAWWIRQGIQRGIEMQSRVVRIPCHAWAQRDELPAATPLLDADRLADPYASRWQEELLDRLEVEGWLAELTPQQATVLRFRFGLDGGGGRTWAQIGGELDLCRSRIGQIEGKALSRLREAVAGG